MQSPLNKNGEPSSVIGTIYSYSTLKSMTKDELIDLLGIAQHNYECVNEQLFNISQYAKKLDKALDEAYKKIGEPEKCWKEFLQKAMKNEPHETSCSNDTKNVGENI